MGWYNDNLAGYNYNPATNQAPKNTDVSLQGYGQQQPASYANSVSPTYKSYTPYAGWQDKANPNAVNQKATTLNYNPNQYSASDNKNTLSYKTNIDGKDYFYSPTSVRVGAGANYAWDPNKAKAMGGVEWNRALPGATRDIHGDNPYSQAQNPTNEGGFLFENDPDSLKNMQYNEWKESSFMQNQGLGLLGVAAGPFIGSALAGMGGSSGAGSLAGGPGSFFATPEAAASAGSSWMGAPAAAAGNAGNFASNFANSGGSPVAVGDATTSSGVGGGFSGNLGIGTSTPGFTGGVPGSTFAGAGTGVGNSSIGGAGAFANTGLTGVGGALDFSKLGSMLKNTGTSVADWFGGLSGGQKAQLGLGLGDLAMRLNQQNQLEDLMNKSADRADALKQPERLPYQQLLSQYMNGGQDITSQPAVKAQLDYAMRQAQAQMAKAGITGSGNVGMATADYANEAMQKSALPYLQYLAGLGGFNQGVGNSGQIMATLGGQATSAPFQGMNSFGNALYNSTIDPEVLKAQQQPWWTSGYNAQQQMMGRGTNSNFMGIS